MQINPAPTVKDLVLVGGGHAQLAVLKHFAMRPMPGLRLTLITRDLHTPYSGMLPGYVAGHYDYDQSHIDLRRLARFAGARIYHSAVTDLDLERKRVICHNRPPVCYDVLSINTGSQPRSLDIPETVSLSLPVKPVERFLSSWQILLKQALESTEGFRILIVGGGASGVEMALATQYRLQQDFKEKGCSSGKLSFQLLTNSPVILPTHNAGVRKRFSRVLQSRNIEVKTDHSVSKVLEQEIVCQNGQRFAFDAILWTTSASAPEWLGQSGLKLDQAGFIMINDALQSVSHPDVFAAGDIATSINHPRPKSGVFAVRQGKPLAANLRRFLAGERPKRFRPQLKFLGLISTGDRYAIASRSDWSLQGAWVWCLKDWIDRRFMRQFDVLPDMDTDQLPAIAPGLADAEVIQDISSTAMRCGGCGAKVGKDPLSRVLSRLETVHRDDVLTGLGKADDAAVCSVPADKVIVQSVDFFRSFIDDPWLFGQIAANHALSDLFAMGAQPQSALAIASLPYGLEKDIEEQLYQLLSGALLVLEQCGAALVGGHTSEALEMSFGLSVTGLANKEQLLNKRGMLAGDVLLLTKPLGTGTLFAADMRHAAKGRWIDEAVRHMLTSSQAAAICLQNHGARACTDITGFGLLGHLLEMMTASGVDTVLQIDALPLIDGAVQTVTAGIFSSLQPQNIRLRRAISNIESASQHPLYPFLFDPQTSGGLLASLPRRTADVCVKQLHELGYAEATIIGEVSNREGITEKILLR